MKRSIYILIAAVCFALAAGSQVYANLVTNPGFEDPIGSEWTWNVVSGTPASHGTDTAITHTGSYSYKIHGGDAVSKGYIEQTLSGLPPGATYNISGWVLVPFRAIDRIGGTSRPWVAAELTRRLLKVATR